MPVSDAQEPHIRIDGCVGIGDRYWGPYRNVHSDPLWIAETARPTGAVSLACANVAGLPTGARELPFPRVRGSRGSGRCAWSACRSKIVESLVPAAPGGRVGALPAECALYAIKHFGAPNLPRVAEIRLDGIVLGFTAALSIAPGATPRSRQLNRSAADALRHESIDGCILSRTCRGLESVPGARRATVASSLPTTKGWLWKRTCWLRTGR
jgi:hypothetical protein